MESRDQQFGPKIRIDKLKLFDLAKQLKLAHQQSDRLDRETEVSRCSTALLSFCNEFSDTEANLQAAQMLMAEGKRGAREICWGEAKFNADADCFFSAAYIIANIFKRERDAERKNKLGQVAAEAGLFYIYTFSLEKVAHNKNILIQEYYKTAYEQGDLAVKLQALISLYNIDIEQCDTHLEHFINIALQHNTSLPLLAALEKVNKFYQSSDQLKNAVAGYLERKFSSVKMKELLGIDEPAKGKNLLISWLSQTNFCNRWAGRASAYIRDLTNYANRPVTQVELTVKDVPQLR